MTSLNNVDYLVAMGNTYPNVAKLKALGARFDNGSKTWTIPVAKHPLNTASRKKKLLAMLNELEECGVRFVVWRLVESA